MYGILNAGEFGYMASLLKLLSKGSKIMDWFTNTFSLVLNGAAVRLLDSRLSGLGLNHQEDRNSVLDFYFTNTSSLTNGAIMSTLTVHCLWEGESTKARTGHLLLSAEAKKMKSSALHTHFYPKGPFFFSFLMYYES